MTEAIAVQDNRALANLPDHLKDQIGNRAGLENIGRDDVLIPRLCIAQQLSPQINKKKESYVPGLEVGDFFNSVTGENYGRKVTVVPLFFFRQFIKFKPIDDGGGILAMYQSEADIPAGETYRLDQVKNSKDLSVTEFKNEMCLLVGEDGSYTPIVVSFKSTGMKTAKKWNSLMRMLPLPAYAKFYVLETVSRTKGEQEWEGSNVTAGEFTPVALFKAAEEYFATLRESGVKVDTTGLGPEDEGSGSENSVPAGASTEF